MHAVAIGRYRAAVLASSVADGILCTRGRTPYMAAIDQGRTSRMLLTLYQHHLPTEVRVFRYLSPPIRMDEEVVVCDGWSSGPPRAYCRSYMFVQRWLHVFVTFDECLAPREDRVKGFSFAFNCDITTPHYRVNDRVYTTDLCVDVLVGASSRECRVKDGDQLGAMYAAGQFGRLWYDAALREAAWVERLVTQGTFIGFLQTAAPLPKVTGPRDISQMAREDLEKMHFVFHPDYPRYG